MAEHKTNLLIPGMATPEGAARLQKEMEARNDIDFRAFQMLRRLHDEGHFSLDVVRRNLTYLGEDKPEADEMAREVVDEIDEIIRDRVMADHKVLAAAAGRPE